MKMLITAATIREHFYNKKETLYIEPNSIVTPAARDAAAELKIKLIAGTSPKVPVRLISATPPEPALDETLIARIVAEVAARINFQQSAGLVIEVDSSGLRLVRGSSLVLEACPGKVKTKEIIGMKESPMTAGFIQLESTSFSKQPKYDEVSYVLQGTLICEISGKKYIGKEGDIFFIPAYRQVTYSTEDKVKLFYAACSIGSDKSKI